MYWGFFNCKDMNAAARLLRERFTVFTSKELQCTLQKILKE